MTTNPTPTELHPTTGSNSGVRPTRKTRKRGLIWVFFLLVVLGTGGYAVWRAGQPGLVPPSANAGGRSSGRGRGAGFGPTPVIVAEAVRKQVPVYLTGLGNVTAFYTVAVKSRVDGQLMAINFEEGDFVEKGQLLAEIDPRPFEVQRDLAEGTLARDTAILANARRDLERYTTLLAQDAIPRQQLDTQTSLVAQYEGNIKQDTANVNSAKLNLTYAKVTAPISGRIGLRLVDPGNIVRAADANGMLVITQLDPISVLFTVPEDSLQQVLKKLRAGVKLSVDAYNRDNSEKLATGQLLTVDNTIDVSTGTSRMKAVFDNKKGTLFPNQFVNIRLEVEMMANQLVIPTVAVQNGQQGTFVYVVEQAEGGPATVHLRPVQVLSSDQSGAVIKSGINAGDRVAVDGADRVQDGGTVRVRKPGEAEAEAAADLAAISGRGRGARGGRGRGTGAGAPGAGRTGGAPTSGSPAGDSPTGGRQGGSRGDSNRGGGRRGGGQ